MFPTMIIAVLLYLTLTAAHTVVMGAIQVASLTVLTFVLADMIKLVIDIRKEKATDEAKGE